MKFSPTFIFYNIEVYDTLIRNFRVWASDKRVRIFPELQSWPIRVKRELKQEDFSRRRRGEIREGPGLTSSFSSQI